MAEGKGAGFSTDLEEDGNPRQGRAEGELGTLAGDEA